MADKVLQTTGLTITNDNGFTLPKSQLTNVSFDQINDGNIDDANQDAPVAGEVLVDLTAFTNPGVYRIVNPSGNLFNILFGTKVAATFDITDIIPPGGQKMGWMNVNGSGESAEDLYVQTDPTDSAAADQKYILQVGEV